MRAVLRKPQVRQRRLWQYAHVVFDLTHGVEPAAAPLK